MIFVLFCWGLPQNFKENLSTNTTGCGAEMRPAPAMRSALLLVLAPAFAFGASFAVFFRFRPSARLVHG
jgi:hypothetical protein